MPKVLNVLVSTVDTDLEFTIQSSTTGKQLFDKVSRSVGVREAWFFGLLFKDTSDQPCWIDLSKKVSAQKIHKQDPLKLRFLAKYFPEDAAEELVLPLTKQLFFLQVRDSVVSEEYYCPAETSVLLASYALHAKYGPYDAAKHTTEFFDKEKMLPDKVLKQHTMTKAEWDQKVIAWYKEHEEMEKETAMVEYLKVAQDLDMYGITYFNISNKKKTKLWLGVDALGINVYGKDDKLTPKIGFPWSDVNKVSYSGKKFVVKPIDPNSPNLVFLSDKSEMNKRIIGLSKGNYEMYNRRRKPDSVEVQQMKAQVREEQEYKERQKKLLLEEKENREKAEGHRKILETQLEDYMKRVEMSNQDLQRSELIANELRERLEQQEVQRRQLEEAQVQAFEARKAAEEAVNAEKTERLLKEQQAAEAQALLEEREEDARQKHEEARQLQEELESARRQIERQQFNGVDQVESATHVTTINTTTIASPLYQTQSFHPEQESGSLGPNDGNSCLKELKQLDNALQAASEQTFTGGQISEHESHEFQRGVSGPERERLSEAEKNLKLGNQLKTLQRELEESKLSSRMTSNDQIYVTNVKQGRDKYKTLKQIRQGNTKIRIETFESL